MQLCGSQTSSCVIVRMLARAIKTGLLICQTDKFYLLLEGELMIIIFPKCVALSVVMGMSYQTKQIVEMTCLC